MSCPYLSEPFGELVPGRLRHSHGDADHRGHGTEVGDADDVKELRISIQIIQLSNQRKSPFIFDSDTSTL